jgi:hypothetical protein
MARVSHTGDRGIGPGATFLEEEADRGRLSGRRMVYPMPHFVQPDTGAHNAGFAGKLGVHYDIANRPMHVGNQTTDLNGGYY